MSTEQKASRATRDTPVEHRRAFASEKEWREKSKAEVMAALDAALATFGAELSVEINGNATADILLTIEEWVNHNGEPGYFYQTIDLGSWHKPEAA